MTGEDSPKILRTTATSIEILELLEETNGARVSQVAERMGRPKSTVHGHLATLKAKEYVIQEGDFYFIGPELLRLGNQVRTRETGHIFAREFTERMFKETGLRSTFAVEMGGKAVFLHTASGNKMGWAHEQLGNRLYLHDTAVGKAILAELPEPRIKQIVDRWGLPEATNNTITNWDALLTELNEVRKQGYATNHAENIKELYAIGVAATRRPGIVIGGFSITGPEHSVIGEGREDELAETVLSLVNEFELELSLAE